jgi:hypothetical protein
MWNKPEYLVSGVDPVCISGICPALQLRACCILFFTDFEVDGYISIRGEEREDFQNLFLFRFHHELHFWLLAFLSQERNEILRHFLMILYLWLLGVTAVLLIQVSFNILILFGPIS